MAPTRNSGTNGTRPQTSLRPLASGAVAITLALLLSACAGIAPRQCTEPGSAEATQAVPVQPQGSTSPAAGPDAGGAPVLCACSVQLREA